MLAGLQETEIVEPSRWEPVARTMQNVRRGGNGLVEPKRSVRQPSRGGPMVVDGHRTEIVSCPASPLVSLPWSKYTRWELDR